MSAPLSFSLKRIAVPAFAPSLLHGVADGAVLPVIAFSALALGASPALAGFVVALTGIGSLLNNMPAAMLTTRFGERRAMLGAAVVAIAAFALCVIADSLVLLGLGVLVAGMAGAVFSLARQTWLIAAVPFGMRARALSTLAGSMRIGMFVGPFAGAAAIHVLGLRGAYGIAILAMLGLILIVWRLPDLPEPVDPGGTERPLAASSTPAGGSTFGDLVRAHRTTFMTLGIGILLIAAMRSSRQVVVPLWGDALGIAPAATSMIYGLAALIDMAVFYPSGKVMDRHGRIWVAVPCALLMAIAFLAMPLTTGLASLLAVAMLLGFGNGIGSGIVMTLGADASPRDGRTRFLGIWRMLADIGISGGPLLLSAVTALVSLATGIMTVGVLGLVAAAIFWRWVPRRPSRAPSR